MAVKVVLVPNEMFPKPMMPERALVAFVDDAPLTTPVGGAGLCTLG